MEKQDVDVRVEQVSSVERKITFTIPWSLVNGAMEQEFLKVKKTATIARFRKGKAPYEMIKKLFGERINAETAASLVKKYYRDELERQMITPTTVPQVGENWIKQGEDFTFSITVEMEPIFDATGYDAMVLERFVAPVTTEDVEARIREIMENYAKIEDPNDDAPLVMGDFARISFQGFCDGVAREDMKAADYLLEIGSRSFIHGFEDGLVGMRVGETRDISSKFSEEHHNEELRSKGVTFTVTLKGIKKKTVPDFNEEFIKNIGHFESVEAFTARVRETLLLEREEEAEAKVRDSIIDRLLESNTFDAPSAYVERQLDMMVSDSYNRLISQGMSREMAERTSMKAREGFRGSAEKIIKTMLLFKGIAAKENIVVTDEEVEANIMEMAKKKDIAVERLREVIHTNDSRERLRFGIFDDKLFSFIKGRANVTEKLAKTTEES